MKNANLIPVPEKLIQVMDYAGTHPGAVIDSELQAALGLSQATGYRLIATLFEHQWLMKTNGNHAISSVFMR